MISDWYVLYHINIGIMQHIVLFTIKIFFKNFTYKNVFYNIYSKEKMVKPIYKLLWPDKAKRKITCLCIFWHYIFNKTIK